MSTNDPSFADKVIDALGGTGKTADICDISASAISQWRSKGIPKGWLRFLQKSHPEIFEDVAPAARAAGAHALDFQPKVAS
jgi:hypothetical protein